MAGPEPKLRDFFSKALQCQTAEEQAAYLEQACPGDAELRARLEELLQAHREAGSFLQEPSPRPVATVAEPIRERPGTVIGPYKLLQQIGEGGMGVVWMAEQTQPVQRKVALKVIKPGMDSRQVIARFEAERQALAMMDHVNIARVFDGGTCGAGVPPASDSGAGVPPASDSGAGVPPASDSDAGGTPAPQGRPYFVMELVHGVPITKYCDDNHLTPRERLELFVPVCQAIQHAHQKGIIHRDIKPSNVMVTAIDPLSSGGEGRVRGIPKVIDFGVAKATEQKLTERTLFTQYGTMIGTLEYMSPEQAEMSALGVDTRSDIYSLGVLLYELLTGSTPLTHKRLKEAAYAEILRMIKEEEPPKPSTRLSDSGEALASISANRHTEPAKLTKLVRGELDWIVMKTLEKDRNRRYETANGFAADVQRYLNDEPVQACPPTAGYRLRKFARRNKRGLVTASLLGMALLLVVATVAGSIGWVLRDRAARQAEGDREAGLALQEAAGLQKQQRWPEALAAVKRAEVLLAGGGSGPLQEQVREVRADLQLVMSLEEIRLEQAAVKDGHFAVKEADPEYEAAFRSYELDIDTMESGEAAARIRSRPIHLEIAAALDDWARVRRLARPKETGWRHLAAVAGAVDPDPFANQVRDAWGRPDDKELERLATEALTRHCPPTTIVLLERGLPHHSADRVVVPLLREAQRRYPDDFWINHQLGQRLYEGDPQASEATRVEEAIGFYRAALALRPKSAGVHLNLGLAMDRKGSLDEAIMAYKESLRFRPEYVEAHNNLGVTLWKKRLLDDAVAAYREAIRFGPDFAPAHYNLGNALAAKGSLDEANAAYRQALRVKPNYAMAYFKLGVALCRQGHSEQGIAAFQETVRLLPDFPSESSFQPAAYSNLGVALFERGRLDEAVAAFREAVRLKSEYPEAHFNLGNALYQKGQVGEAILEYKEALRLKPDYAKAYNNLANALVDKTNFDEAIVAYREAMRLRPDNAEAHNNLASLLTNCLEVKLRDPASAVQLAKKAVALGPRVGAFWNTLGVAHYRVGAWKESVTALEESVKLRNGGDGNDWFFLAMAHWQLGDKRQARKWYDRAIEWMEKNKPRDEELRRFHAEARGLLGIQESVKPKKD